MDLWQSAQALKTLKWVLFSLVLHGVFAYLLSGQGELVVNSNDDALVIDLTRETSWGPKASQAPAASPKTPRLSSQGSDQGAAPSESSSSESQSVGTSKGTEAAVAWSEVTRPPRVLNEIKAIYPLSAKQAGVSGPVVLEVVIDRKGQVREAKVVSGPGYGLDESAKEALKQFEFAPALRGTEPVDVKIRYTYRFKLEVN